MKNPRISALSAVLLCIGAWLFSPILRAQSGGTGALTVNISDPSGKVIPGATVKISNSAAVTRSQTTGENGGYTFTLLPPGTYEISVASSGFQPVTGTEVTVDVTETAVLNQSLQLGIQAANVVVTSTIDNLQTETSALGGVVNETSLVSIPLASRNY